MIKFLSVCIAIILPGAVLADVQIVFQDGATMSGNGKQSRLEDRSMQGFVLVNNIDREIEFVDPQRNEVMVVSMDMKGGETSESGDVDVSLNDMGEGPVIARYATRKFGFFADGNSCGTIFTSLELLKNKGVRGLFDAMRDMQRQSRQMSGGLGGVIGVCERADLLLIEKMESVGVPLRVLDERGNVDSEVVSVDTDISFPSGYYRAPANMNRVTMEDKVNQSAQQTGEMMQGVEVPNIEELMKQMEGSGMEIPDEAMEQLKQLQQQLGQ